MKQVANIPESMGIAIVGQNPISFAVRCRKEHLHTVRGTIYPESIQVEMANIQPDDKLFTLKYVQDQLTSEHLTAALVQIGWEAKAIKPTGSHSWLVASENDPPSQWTFVYQWRSHCSCSGEAIQSNCACSLDTCGTDDTSHSQS